jgi:hypothetical protein
LHFSDPISTIALEASDFSDEFNPSDLAEASPDIVVDFGCHIGEVIADCGLHK